jgi:hypothetical protein
MYSKQSIILLILFIPVQLFFIMGMGRSEPVNSILVDKIAASVDDEIITFADIEKAIRFYSIIMKNNETEKEFQNRVLEDLINHKVVSLEYKNDYVLEVEDYDQVQTAIIEKLGSLDKLNNLLQSYAMDWSDFKAFIKEKVGYEKVLNKLLKVKTSIKFNEIEDFYKNDYLPNQEKLGLKPMSLIEMTPIIENHLRKERTQEELSGWLKEIRSSFKIDNKLSKDKENK